MMNSNVRGPAPQGPPGKQRPPFPNPIQRPGGPPTMSGQRPPNMQHFNNSGSNSNMKTGSSSPGNSASGPQSGGPLNLGAMNMGGNALLNNMLINAAKSMLSMGMSGGPNGGNTNHFGDSMKGPGPGSSAAPGAYTGPSNRDGLPRQGPPSMNKGISGPNGPPHSMGGGPSQRGGPGNNGPPPPAPGSYPGPPNSSGPANSLKAQQAQQRQALLNHAKNFLNNPNGTKNNSKSSPQDSGSAPTSGADEKKPALAMVSNPSLVGTSVKINLRASSNTSAPAIPDKTKGGSKGTNKGNANKASGSVSANSNTPLEGQRHKK